MENNNQILKEESFWEKYKWPMIIGAIILVAVALVSLLLIKEPSRPETIIAPKEKEQKVRAPKGLTGSLYLDLEKKEVKVGDKIKVAIRMDTNNYNITAAAGFVDYDEKLLEVEKIETQDSVLTMGAERKDKDGVVSIVRGNPGDRDWTDSDDGFTGSSGVLGKIVFKALKAGEAKLNFVEEKSRLILDDGYGTSMKMSYENLKIRIN